MLSPFEQGLTTQHFVHHTWWCMARICSAGRKAFVCYLRAQAFPRPTPPEVLHVVFIRATWDPAKLRAYWKDCKRQFDSWLAPICQANLVHPCSRWSCVALASIFALRSLSQPTLRFAMIPLLTLLSAGATRKDGEGWHSSQRFERFSRCAFWGLHLASSNLTSGRTCKLLHQSLCSTPT